jgi:ornithine decarboxylase
VAWTQMFPTIRPFFAVKCNPDPMITSILGQCGAGFDCASLFEIQLALKSGTTSDIVYANPQRAEQELQHALQLGIRALTFDGVEELQKIKMTATNNPSMILRLLVPDGKSRVPLGEKFGIPLDQVTLLAERAVALELPIIGVSFHCGSGNHDPEAYATAIDLAVQAMEIIKRIQSKDIDCSLLDIGGGYPGWDGRGGDVGRFVGTANHEVDEQGEVTAANIAEAVIPQIKALDDTHSGISCLAEPGRYFCEGSFILCSRIYRRSIVDDHYHYYIAHGVEGLFKDVILVGESFTPIPLVEPTDKLQLSTVHGPSGKDQDVICSSVELPILTVGDWLVFDRMGAYTISIASRNDRPTTRYVVGGQH